MASSLAVVSPGGKVHAVRPQARATACGLNYHKETRRSGRRFLGWVITASSFEEFHERGQVLCLNCIENLKLGTGPQAVL